MRGVLLPTLLLLACTRKESEDALPAPVTAPAEPSVTTSAAAPAPVASGPGAIPSPRARRPPPFEGTAGIIEVKRDPQTPRIVALRSARHDGYDRVVFEIRGPLPGYHLEYVDKPVRQCGSGDPVAVEGDAWLEVRLTPAHAHDDAGHGFLGERSQKVRHGVIRQIERTCDFEAIVTHVIGVSTPNRFRVLELSDPPRIAVDILNE
jgi:hypothetical protein